MSTTITQFDNLFDSLATGYTPEKLKKTKKDMKYTYVTSTLSIENWKVTFWVRYLKENVKNVAKTSLFWESVFHLGEEFIDARAHFFEVLWLQDIRRVIMWPDLKSCLDSRRKGKSLRRYVVLSGRKFTLSSNVPSSFFLQSCEVLEEEDHKKTSETEMYYGEGQVGELEEIYYECMSSSSADHPDLPAEGQSEPSSFLKKVLSFFDNILLVPDSVNKISKFTSAISDKANGVSQGFADIVDFISGVFGASFNFLKGLTESVVSSIVGFVKALVERVKNFLVDLLFCGKSFSDSWKTLFSGFLDTGFYTGVVIEIAARVAMYLLGRFHFTSSDNGNVEAANVVQGEGQSDEKTVIPPSQFDWVLCVGLAMMLGMSASNVNLKKTSFNDIAVAARNVTFLVGGTKAMWVLVGDSVTNWINYFGVRFFDWCPLGATPELKFASYRTWRDEVIAISNNRSNLDTECNAMPFRIMLANLTDRSLSIRSTIRASPDTVREFETLNAFLFKVYVEKVGKLAITGARAEPIPLYLFGESGVGKSFLTATIFRTLVSRCGLSGDYRNHVYTRNYEDFWSGYASQLITYYDDFGSVNDSTSKPNVQLAEILGVVSANSLPLPMASLESKGCTYFSSPFVVYTSNYKMPVIRSLGKPEALERRLGLRFEVKPRPEFRAANGSFQNPKPGEFHEDVHEFTYHCADKRYKEFEDGKTYSFKEVIEGLMKEKTIAMKLMNASGNGGKTALALVECDNFPLVDEPLSDVYDLSDAWVKSVWEDLGEEEQSEIMARLIPQGEDVDEIVFEQYPPPKVFETGSCDDNMVWWRNIKKQGSLRFTFPERIGDLMAHRKWSGYVNGSPFQLRMCRHSGTVITVYEALKCFRSSVLAESDGSIRFEVLSVDRPNYEIAFIKALYDHCLKCRDCKVICTKKFTPPTDLVTSEAFFKQANEKFCMDWLMILSGAVSAGMAVYGASTLFSNWKRAEGQGGDWYEGLLSSVRPRTIREMRSGAPRDYTSPLLKQAAMDKYSQGAGQVGEIDFSWFAKVRQRLGNFFHTKGKGEEAILGKAQALATQAGVCPVSYLRTLKVAKDVVIVYVGDVKESLTPIVMGFAVSNDCIVTVKHAGSTITRRQYCQIVVPYRNFATRVFDVKEAVMKPIPNLQEGDGDRYRDLVVWILPSIQLFSSIKFASFPSVKDEIIKSFPGAYVGAIRPHNDDECATVISKQAQSVRTMSKILEYTTPDGLVHLTSGYEVPIKMIKGDCASVLISSEQDDTAFIKGFHVGASGVTAFAEPLFREELAAVLSLSGKGHVGTLDVDTQNLVPVSNVLFDEVLATPNRPLPVGSFEMLEDTTYKRDGVVNSYHKTPAWNWHGKSTRIPADVAGPDNDPYLQKLKGITKAGKPSVLIDDGIVEAAVVCYENVLLQFPHPDERKIWTIEESVFGQAGVEYAESLETSTSPGFPWTQQPHGIEVGKKHWIDVESKWISPKLRQAVLERLVAARSGISLPCYCSDSLKVELREPAKASAPRVFSTLPMDFNILFRMYFGEFCRYIMINHIHNQVGVGINVHSHEWNVLYHKMRAYGSKGFAGDFHNFDGTLVAAILMKFGETANIWYKGSPEDERIRMVLLEQIVYATHYADGLVYRWTHGQPSGNPVTSILNSYYNNVVMRIAYGLCLGSPMKSIASFNFYVWMCAYGDDNVIAVKEPMLAYFNQGTATKALALLGMIYTDENKTGHVIDVRPIDDISFLKRNFVYKDDFQRVIGQLPLDRVNDIPCWFHSKLDKARLMKETVASFEKELSYFGKEVYDHSTSSVKNILRGTEEGKDVEWHAHSFYI